MAHDVGGIYFPCNTIATLPGPIEPFQSASSTPMSVHGAFLLGGLALKQPDLGVLREGTKADVLVFSIDALGLIGWSDPVAAIVLHSNVVDIDGIYVDGNWSNRAGKWSWIGLGKDTPTD
ncbi:hypothetical protein C8J56DRAFT_897480 [Mycena floridula]|nr:hypothetical protein C8J56DRAFT_897480 [Mycena floridula]